MEKRSLGGEKKLQLSSLEETVPIRSLVLLVWLKVLKSGATVPT